MTALKLFSISSLGRECGVYLAPDAEGALLKHFKEDGYENFEEVVEKFKPMFSEQEIRDSYDIKEIEDLMSAA